MLWWGHGRRGAEMLSQVSGQVAEAGDLTDRRTSVEAGNHNLLQCQVRTPSVGSSRRIFGFNSIKSIKTSAWRRSSSAILGGWVAVVESPRPSTRLTPRDGLMR